MELPAEIVLMLKWGTTILLTVIFGVYMTLIVRSLQACKWPKVSAQLMHADIDVEEHEDGGIYTPAARYKYTVNGFTYISQRIGFGLWGTNIRWLTERTLAHACSHPLFAFYNPENPAESVVIRGFTLHHFVCMSLVSSTLGIVVYMLISGL